MFDYNTEHAKALRAFFAKAHENGDAVEFAGAKFFTYETLADDVNVCRAILVIADSMSADDFEYLIEEIYSAVELGYIRSPYSALAEEYAIAINGYAIIENADGSAHAVPAAKRVTDTTAVIIRHANGTTTTAVQTPSDALAVIEKGHATLATKFENGEIDNYVDDIATDELV